MNQELVVYRMVWWFQRLVRWLPRTLLTILLHRLLKADRAKAVAWLLTRTGQPVKHTFTTLRWGPARRRWEEVHLVHLAALHGSFHTLRWLLQHDLVESAIIFANRKTTVRELNKSLKQHGFRSGEIHGDMEQPQRLAELLEWKAPRLPDGTDSA